jgi:hypothetical protein
MQYISNFLCFTIIMKYRSSINSNMILNETIRIPINYKYNQSGQATNQTAGGLWEYIFGSKKSTRSTNKSAESNEPPKPTDDQFLQKIYNSHSTYSQILDLKSLRKDLIENNQDKILENIKNGAQSLFNEAIMNDDVYKVTHLLKNPIVDPSYNFNQPIKQASKKGNKEIINMLLNHPKFNKEKEFNIALGFAAENGHRDSVKTLLDLKQPKLDVNHDNSYALKFAYANGHDDIVELLKTQPDLKQSILDDKIIQSTRDHGTRDIIKLMRN